MTTGNEVAMTLWPSVIAVPPTCVMLTAVVPPSVAVKFPAIFRLPEASRLSGTISAPLESKAPAAIPTAGNAVEKTAPADRCELLPPGSAIGNLPGNFAQDAVEFVEVKL